MDPRIRIARPADAAALAALVERAYAAGLRTAYPESVLKGALPHLAKVEPDLLECGTFYVAELDGVIAACGGWTPWPPGAARVPTGVAHLRQFATDPAHVRRGYARELLHQGLTAAAEAGFDRAEVVATRVAVPFYTDAGFDVRRQRAIRLPGDVAFAAVELGRTLP